MSTLYEIIKDEFDKRGYVKVPGLLERFSISIGCHIFKQVNLKKKTFFHGGSTENFRNHIIMMSPSGYGRSMLFRLFLDEESGFLSRTDSLPTNITATFSPESWMGTAYKYEGEIKTTKGVFGEFKEGIVGADEYMKIKKLMDGTGVENEEVYLMTALDYDKVDKKLSLHKIREEGIGTTFWCGMRPSQITLTSGLARRFSFQIFFPTLQDARKFKLANRNKEMKKKISSETLENIDIEIARLVEEIKTLSEINYSGVNSWVNGNEYIPHFEETIFRRLGLGWGVANGTPGDIKVDDTLKSIFKDELKSRWIIRTDPIKEAIFNVIEAGDTEPGKIERTKLLLFARAHYQMHVYKIHNAISTLIMEDRIKESCGILQVKKGNSMFNN